MNTIKSYMCQLRSHCALTASKWIDLSKVEFQHLWSELTTLEDDQRPPESRPCPLTAHAHLAVGTLMIPPSRRIQ